MCRNLIAAVFAALLGSAAFAATPTVTSVTAQQRYPWNGNVDIVVTLSGASNDVARAECVFAATNSATKAALPVAHVTPEGEVAGSGTAWTRRFVWDATADVGEVKIADVALSVEAEMPLGGVQLWENGPYWAECNVGASKPEEYGYYFWWGDTVGYTPEGGTWTDDSYFRGVTWISSKGTLMDSSPFNYRTNPTYNKTILQLQLDGYVDSTGNLVAEHDAATVHLGAPWRMPTTEEFDALLRNCTISLITTKGVNGLLVKGMGAFATKSIFLPAAGYGSLSTLNHCGSQFGFYWSSTPYWDNSDPNSDACELYFDPYYPRCCIGSNDRVCGQSIRPLRGSASALTSAVTHLTIDCCSGTRYARAEEPITFSTDWSESVTRLVLNVDGANVLMATTATNGVYVWKPDLSTVRTVTVKHTTRGTVNEALTATFTTAAYDVTFDAGAHGTLSGGVPATQRVPHGEAAETPEVVPAAGYRFTGWNADISNVTGDVTATAQYEAIPYAITYEDLYGATHGNPSTYTVEDAVTFTAPGSIPRRQFVRWEPASIAAGSTGAVTVRAIWETTPCVYVDAGQGNDAWDGSLADQAVKTLARAYELAEPGDIILVAAGTYGPVTATGKAVTFRGADGATIDGGGTDRCVTADADVVFENFTIQNGYDAEAGGGVYGGTFERCTIRDCVSEWDGGGAYEATLRNCVIVGNEAVNGWGGGAYGGTLDHCVVKDNVAGDMGGGVYEPVCLSETTFSGNLPEDAANVGGIVTAGGSSVYVPSGSSAIYSIPHDWLMAAGLAKAGEPTAGLDAKLAAPYAEGLTGWEAFVAGLTARDPAFRADVEMVDGEVRISWAPNLNTGAVNRIYAVLGRTDFDKGDWETPVQPWHRFFKVTVAMPTGVAGERSAVAGEGFVPEEKPLGGVQLWENGP